MTGNNRPSILATARSDPLGAGIIVCAVALLVALTLHFLSPYDAETGEWRWPEILSAPRRVPKPLARPPDAWLAKAAPGDVLSVPGFPVAYWGRPDASYGERVTAESQPIAGIVVHFTDETPALALVRYGHSADQSRGGAAYGYHVYIDQAGRVLQGAPLSRRTNHVKPVGAAPRRSTAPDLDGRNTIGVALIGACRSPRLAPVTYQCRSETPTDAQLSAGVAVVAALQQRMRLACREIYGHGELQSDRRSFEGLTLSRIVRARC